MTMPASGPLNMGGTSSPVSVAQELGLSLTATISMNDAAVRTLAGVGGSGTSWSMSSLYGKSNRKPGVTYAYRDSLSRAVSNPSAGAIAITSNGSTMVLAGSSLSPNYTLIGSTTDGTTWTRRTDPYDSALSGSTITAYQAAANNGGTRFFVGGTAGYGAVSNDSGVTWSQVTGIRATTFGANTIHAAAASSSLFVVCGTNRAVATSPDCVTWTYRLMPTITSTNELRAALYAFSLYWVAGRQARLLTSPDGVTWTYSTAFTTALGGTTSYVQAMAANGTRVVVGGANQSLRPAILYGGTSAAGPWTMVDFVTLFAWPTSNNVFSLTWNGSVFCVGTRRGYVATSPDGITWTDRSSAFRSVVVNAFNALNFQIDALASRGSLIVATSQYTINYGSGPVMAYSTDNGATWTSNTSIANNYSTYWSLPETVFCADATGPKWICGGSTALVATSSNYGVTWTTSHSIQNNLGASWGLFDVITGVCWYAPTSQYFAFGGQSKGAVSSDGITWTYINVLQPTIGFTTQIYGCLSANGAILVYASGRVFFTTNGTTWGTDSTSTTIGPYGSACFTGTRWLVGGSSGSISYSTNAAPNSIFSTTSALAATSFGSQTVRGLASNGTVTVAVGGTNAAVGTSTDSGVSWTYRSGLNAIWGAVAASGVTWSAAAGLFAAVGTGGRLATSPDGITWTNVTAMSSSSWGSSTSAAGVIQSPFSTVPNSEPQVIVSSSGGSDWLILGANGRCFTSPA